MTEGLFTVKFPKSSYTCGMHSGLHELKDPPAEFWPVYSWEWNDTITPDGILRRLRSMRERGIRAFYILPMPPEFRPHTMPTHMSPGYPTHFAVPAGIQKDYVLDLGKVCHSCQVILNGKALEPMIFTPFRVRLPRLGPENTLIIRVSNTAANAFVHTDFSRWYPEWMLGPYHKKELEFERESLESGLYGPVTLLW